MHVVAGPSAYSTYVHVYVSVLSVAMFSSTYYYQSCFYGVTVATHVPYPEISCDLKAGPCTYKQYYNVAFVEDKLQFGR